MDLLLGVDSETTGVDLHHGAKPYFVTFCNQDGEQEWYEWDVDPLTRQPIVPDLDVVEIYTKIRDARELVLQNPKFDVAALHTVGVDRAGWPWEKTRCTLIAGHLLASNKPHNLTDMALTELSVNIEPFEERLKAATNEARAIARSKFPDWRIAKEGLPEMPSASGGEDKKAKKGVPSDKPWKFDGWLPRAMALELGYALDHPWWTVLRDYGNADSAITVALYQSQIKRIRDRGLEAIYEIRLKVLPVTSAMEHRGVTINGKRQSELKNRYKEDAEGAVRKCKNVAAGYGFELNLSNKGAKTKSLGEFVFDVMKVPVLEASPKTGAPKLDKRVIEQYETLLPTRSRELFFIRNLRAARQRGTAATYLEGYERFWLPLKNEAGWYVLFPSLNPTGTDTLRFSSSCPNSQNISKKENFNLRFCFGPAPSREWWSCDAKNIELRLPAYECGEQELIDLFERANDPPYYGSEHLLNFSTVYPDIWERDLKEVGFDKVGPYVKKKYADTWYQWCKNGDFAVGYGAIERSDKIGTADKAFHREGSHALLKQRFSKKEALNRHYIALANKYGYVETMPDKSVDPEHGYPLLCTRNDWGRILETVPLNYHVQGTAMWWTMKGMIRCYEFLEELNQSREAFRSIMGRNKSSSEERGGYHLTLQVHDELVFDFPKGHGANPWKTNLPIMREVARLLELGGDDLGVPTPVGIEYHADNYSEGKSIEV